jgi:hypothetical protein
MDRAVLPIINKSVVSLFRGGEGSISPHGTGTLFRIADEHFLVTAAHVVDGLGEFDWRLYVADYKAGSNLVALEGDLTRTLDNKVQDVAIFRLAQRTVDTLVNRVFLSLTNVDFGMLQPRPGWYYVFGYPVSQQKVDKAQAQVATKPFAYGSHLFSGPTASLNGFDARLHLLVHVYKNANVDSSGSSVYLPRSFLGISGASIWRAYANGESAASWTASTSLKVVSVETCVYPDANQDAVLVRGTKWWLVRRMLIEQYPSMVRVFSLHG